VKIRIFIPLVWLACVCTGCQTTSQKTHNDPFIKESLDKAAIPPERCAIVAVAAKSSGRIISQPIYHGVMTLSGRVKELLDENWVGKPVAAFDMRVHNILQGPVQEYGYPEADRTVFIYSN